MKCRCGIEGILCVVRDNVEYEFGPQWFFTSPEIDSFLAMTFPTWDTNVIAFKLEKFGMTGCDMLRELIVHPGVDTTYHTVTCQDIYLPGSMPLGAGRRSSASLIFPMVCLG